jgi:CBS-domain-containing membrane protein
VEPKQPLVADVMSIDPIAIRIDAPLVNADQLLRSTDITGIPVIDADRVLVGVIGHFHLTAYRFAHRQNHSNSNETRPDSLRRRRQ